MNKIITVENLYKSYGHTKAVNGIDFYVDEGSLFAFLGPNGAGKTTTINILSTLLTKDDGEVIINGIKIGENEDDIRKSIGIVFQEGVLDPLLSVKENLETRGSFYGLTKDVLAERVEAALLVTGIQNIASRKYGSLSGGQKRRADIARALINAPKILFLDEPTTGLDPQTRKRVWNTIIDLQKEQKMTVFLTTHYMEEADKADYVVIIDNGKIVAKGTPSFLKDNYSKDLLKIKPINSSILEKNLNSRNILFEKKIDIYQVKLENSLESIDIINMNKDNIESFQVLNGTMDDAFINITGKEIRE
ncbi:MAG: ABC transporter ATP-binding protein [Candidatus Izemoplasmatales bacterium]|nr:ABC transporter ATP-binding protein [Candidatus Izemoplasmatales bacterium]MDD4070391.1 ABC transporter ATP-binding protein [Candidatus Izemoplasmatales bacterium]MDY0139249.1 ABC transporter ATP-binding protein [Candidatus Izemoplasmatales bacterium]